MLDINSEESQNAIRMSWNILPANAVDLQRYIFPCGIHYTPLKSIENMKLLDYEPVRCRQCRSVLSPAFQLDFRAKAWICPFCNNKNAFPKEYAQHITPENLPMELLQTSSTIEYKLNQKESKYPVFFFIIDTSITENELNELKETIQSTLSAIPPECEIGIITSGTMCNLLEIGFTDFPKMFVFKGDKPYTPNEIITQLGLVNKNDPRVQTTSSKKFFMPLKDCEFSVNSFLDDLFPDPFPQGFEERKASCLGLSLNVAVTLLETLHNNQPSRIFLFAGSPCNTGLGKIVNLTLKETIRNYLDFEKKNDNTKHFKEAVNYYRSIAERAFKSNQIIDIFSCCLNQVGLYEMKNMASKTGGYIIFTDSFSTIIFKDSFRKIFELDDKGFLKMNFKGKLNLNCTHNYKVSGALGHLVSLTKKTPLVSDVVVGEGNTVEWFLGSLTENSTYTFFLDYNDKTKEVNKIAIFQILTTYVAGDRSWRLRVSTIRRKISNPLMNQNAIDEIGNSFDQEAAAVLMGRLCVDNSFKGQDLKDALKWIDKSLIHLMSKFAKYTKDNPNSFRLTTQFNYFPQFIFYLRRSSFVQSFNESPDESTYYKYLLLGESVENCIIMIQPLLFEYTADNPTRVPVFLDLNSLKNDCVLLLDTFFHVVVWHGSDVVKWREEGFQDEEGYENVKQMLEEPQDYAQNILEERIPTPKFVSCDYGSGQERLLKYVVNPSSESKNKLQEEGFFSDDVDLKIFMDSLKRLAVSS